MMKELLQSEFFITHRETIIKGGVIVLIVFAALIVFLFHTGGNDDIELTQDMELQTAEEREENFARLASGKVRVILANPEVLQNEALVRRLAHCHISHVAIDEAHCVSEWGDSFRPAYLTLGDVIKKLGVQVVTAFTATASPPVLQRVVIGS